MFYRLLLITVLITSSVYSQNWFGINENWKEVLYEKSAPAVVIVYKMNNKSVAGFGSGFNIDKNGLIVTNYHVVQEAEEVFVEFKNGDRYEALHYTFVDKHKDFVVLKIAGHNLPITKLGNSDEVKIGQEVVAIGNPEGQWHSMTGGMISQLVPIAGHQLFQTDVTIAPGSSGGPLFNSDNQVIAITSSGLEVGLDINYAIPSKYVLGAINSSSSNTKKLIGYDRNAKLDEIILIVKNGSFVKFPNQTIGDATEKVIKNPQWTSFFREDNGQALVNLKGGLLSGGKPVEILWQFNVDETKKSFTSNAIEFDGIPQGDDVAYQVLELLFNENDNQTKPASTISATNTSSNSSDSTCFWIIFAIIVWQSNEHQWPAFLY